MFAVELKMRFITANAAKAVLSHLGHGFAVHPSGKYFTLRMECDDAEKMLPRVQRQWPHYQFALARDESAPGVCVAWTATREEAERYGAAEAKQRGCQYIVEAGVNDAGVAGFGAFLKS